MQHRYVVIMGRPKGWVDSATTHAQYEYAEMYSRYIRAVTERELRLGDVMPITRRGNTVFFVHEHATSHEGVRKAAFSIRYQVPDSAQVEVLVRGYDAETVQLIQNAFIEAAGDWYTPTFISDLKG